MINQSIADTKAIRPIWFAEYQEALATILMEDSEPDHWSASCDILFGEEEWKDGEYDSTAQSKPIVANNEHKQNAYRTLLECNCVGLNLSNQIYHVTTVAWLNEARKRNGFILSRPGDWSVNWEDTAFKTLLKESQPQGQQSYAELAEAYMKYSYGMCWSLDVDNGNVIGMMKRKHPREDIAIISSTAEKLLSAYVTDNLSARGCHLIRMNYSSGSNLKAARIDSADLESGDVGTSVHHEAIANTHNKFKTQNEVRLIVEDCPNDLKKTTLVYKNYETGKAENKLIKHVDLDSIITSIKVVKNEYTLF